MNESKCDYPELVSYLKANGWVCYNQPLGGRKEVWCKRYRDAETCQCNDDKPGIQAALEVYGPFLGAVIEHDTYQLDVTGEKPGGMWVKLQAYSLDRESIIEVLESEALQLVEAWNFMCRRSNPQKEIK